MGRIICTKGPPGRKKNRHRGTSVRINFFFTPLPEPTKSLFRHRPLTRIYTRPYRTVGATRRWRFSRKIKFVIHGCQPGMLALDPPEIRFRPCASFKQKKKTRKNRKLRETYKTRRSFSAQDIRLLL